MVTISASEDLETITVEFTSEEINSTVITSSSEELELITVDNYTPCK